MSSQPWHELLRRYIGTGEEQCLQDALENASTPDTRDLIAAYVSAGPDRYIDGLTELLSDRPEPYVEPGERTFILLEYFLHVRKAADRSVSLSEEKLRQRLEMTKEGAELSEALSAATCKGRFMAFRGRIHWRLGEYDRALSALGAAIESYQEDSENDGPDLLLNRAPLHVLRGSILGDRERLSPALEAFREALDVLEGMEGEEALYYRAVAYVDRANVLRRSNEHRRAEADLGKGLELFRTLTGEALPKDLSGEYARREGQPRKRANDGGDHLGDTPDGKALWTERADALSIRAAVRGDLGKLHEAEEDLNRAIEILEALGAGAPEADRAKTYASRGNVRKQAGRYWEARTDYDAAIQHYERLDATLHRRDRAIARANRADVRIELGDPRGAELDCNEALTLLRKSDEEAGRASRINALLTRGIAREKRGEWADAEADFDAGLKLVEDLPRNEPPAPGPSEREPAPSGNEKYASGQDRPGLREEADRADRALLHLNRGAVRVRRGRQKEAKADFDRALSLYKDLGKVHDQDRALALINRSDLHRGEGDLEAAEADLTRALSLLGDLSEEGARETRAFARSIRGSLRHEQGELEAAEKDCTASLQLYDELMEKLSRPPGQSEEAVGKSGNEGSAGAGPPYLTDRTATLMHRGIVRWNREDLAGARADFNAALALLGEEHQGFLKADRALVHLNRGLLFLEEGELESARDALSVAANLAEAARAGRARLGDRGHVQAEFANVFRGLTDVHLRLFEKTGQRAHLHRAWHAVERGRGRRLLDQFGSDGLRLETGDEGEAAEKLKRVRQEIRDLTARLRRDQNSGPGPALGPKIETAAGRGGADAEGPRSTSSRRSFAPQSPLGLRPESRHRLKSRGAREGPGSRQLSVLRRPEENEGSSFSSEEDRKRARKRLEDLIEREETLNRRLLREFGADVSGVPSPEKLGRSLRALAGEEGGLLVQWVRLGPATPPYEEQEAPERFALFLLPTGEVSATNPDDSGEHRDLLPLQARVVSVPPEVPSRWRAAVNRLERRMSQAGNGELPKSERTEALAEARSELDQLLDTVGGHLTSPLVEAIREEVEYPSSPAGSTPGGSTTGGPTTEGPTTEGPTTGDDRPSLLMVPDGVLSMLPMHAARLPNGEPLFTEWPVTYLGSAATARRLLQPEDGEATGGGLSRPPETARREKGMRSENEGHHPYVSIFGPPSKEGLRGALGETRRVQDLWEETESQVLTCALEEMTVDAFVKCAEEVTLASLHTHSEFRAGRDYPNSQIRFYDGGLRLGQLAVDERLEFPQLRFVRLSSCQSARSSRKEGELRGLVWAFLQSGAGAVEGTLWHVPDESAREHGTAVHEALREGKTITEAHCQALRRVRRERPEDLFAWASFALYGNGFQRVI